MDRRSLNGLIERYQSETEASPTKRVATIKAWSSRFNWQSRCAQFDLVMADEKVQEWARRKEELNELAWEQGMTLRRKVMSQSHINPGELRLVVSSWVDVDKVQRLAVDAPTDNVRQMGPGAVRSGLEHELERLGYSRAAPAISAAKSDPNPDPDSPA